MTTLDWPVLYDYATWANGRVLTAAETLTDDDWRRSLGHSFDSLHGTMVHVLSSEMLWLARWRGQSPTGRAVAADDVPTVAALRARWADVSRDMRDFLAALEDGQWQQEIGYVTLDGRPARYPLWQMYLQVINHGTHHRAEAATMLTDLGQPPAPLDMIFFFRELQAPPD